METIITDFDLSIRYQILRFFADRCKAPEYREIADLHKLEPEDVRGAYHKLHEHHLVFLEPGTDAIRMAHPFSGIPTNYRVIQGNKRWFSNCAWDSLGIPAALNIDARIEGICADDHEPIELQVKNGTVDGKGLVVYFPLPFRHWYDDLIFT